MDSLKKKRILHYISTLKKVNKNSFFDAVASNDIQLIKNIPNKGLNYILDNFTKISQLKPIKPLSKAYLDNVLHNNNTSVYKYKNLYFVDQMPYNGIVDVYKTNLSFNNINGLVSQIDDINIDTIKGLIKVPENQFKDDIKNQYDLFQIKGYKNVSIFNVIDKLKRKPKSKTKRNLKIDSVAFNNIMSIAHDSIYMYMNKYIIIDTSLSLGEIYVFEMRPKDELYNPEYNNVKDLDVISKEKFKSIFNENELKSVNSYLETLPTVLKILDTEKPKGKTKTKDNSLAGINKLATTIYQYKNYILADMTKKQGIIFVMSVN